MPEEIASVSANGNGQTPTSLDAMCVDLGMDEKGWPYLLDEFHKHVVSKSRNEILAPTMFEEVAIWKKGLVQKPGGGTLITRKEHERLLREIEFSAREREMTDRTEMRAKQFAK